MREYALLIYEFIVSFLPFLSAYACFSRFYRKRSVPVSTGRNVLLFLFAFYLIAVLYLTGFGTVWEGLLYHWEIRNVNLLPFSREIDFTAYCQNVLLFMPFGFLCPMLWKEIDRPFVTVASGLSLSLLIEASQLLNSRATDVDDLVMNTLGALIGYLLYRIFSRFYSPARVQAAQWEMAVYIAAISLGRFLLYNEAFLVRLLYQL